jgi:hypothetical protein
MQHPLRQVEGGDERPRVGVFEQEARVAAVAAAGVEDAPAAADVARLRADQPAGQRLMQPS